MKQYYIEETLEKIDNFAKKFGTKSNKILVKIFFIIASAFILITLGVGMFFSTYIRSLFGIKRNEF